MKTAQVLWVATLATVALLVAGCNDTSAEPSTTTPTTPSTQDDSNFGKFQTRTDPENGSQQPGVGVGGGWQMNPDGSLGYDFGF